MVGNDEKAAHILINKCSFSSSTINKMKHDKGTSTTTINDLCNILSCDVDDIMVHIPDDIPYRTKSIAHIDNLQ